MRATRAYIASMGTAAVMLVASLVMFAFVGTLVSFGAWPGLGAHEDVDTLLVESVTTGTPEPLRISTRPRPAATTQAGAGEGVRRAAAPGLPAASVPLVTAPAGPVPQGQAPAPAVPQPAGGGTLPGTPAPSDPVERTTTELDNAVETVSEQLGEIVGEVGGQVDRTVDGAGQVTGGLLR